MLRQERYMTPRLVQSAGIGLFGFYLRSLRKPLCLILKTKEAVFFGLLLQHTKLRHCWDGKCPMSEVLHFPLAVCGKIDMFLQSEAFVQFKIDYRYSVNTVLDFYQLKKA